MTKRVWQIHSWLGLIAGAGLLVIGLTGSLLVFRAELDGLLSAEQVFASGQPRQSLDTLLANVRRALPDLSVSGWLIPTDPRRADVVYLAKAGMEDELLAWVDAGTGEVRGGTQTSDQTVTGWLLDLHDAFLAGHTGLFITGTLAVLLCLLGVTGVWLYRDFWRSFFTLRWGKSWRIVFSDVHKLIGITSVAFNLLLGFTGAYWNLTHVIGHWLEKAESPAKSPPFVTPVSLDKVVAELAQHLPGFKTRYLALPQTPDGEVTLYGISPSRNPLRSDYGSSVAFDGQTGALKTVTDIRQATLWKQTEDAFAPLHFGSFGGVPVKVLWSVFGLAPGALAITGAVVSWKRRPKTSSVSK